MIVPRALTIASHTVGDGERAGFLEGVRARRAALAARGCHLWLFEHPDRRGAFVEFTEGRDAPTLAAARAAAPGAAPVPILTEVELT